MTAVETRGGRGGFTIVELLMVIAVLAALMGIVTTGAVAAVRSARDRRATAMRATLQAGLASYYAQNDKWPGELNNYAEKGSASGTDRTVLLSPTETDNVFTELVRESIKRGSSPYLDPSGLFAAMKSTGRKRYGNDFRDVLKKHRNNWQTTFKAFGYPDQNGAYFRRFWIEYNFETDQAVVMRDDEKRGLQKYKDLYKNE